MFEYFIDKGKTTDGLYLYAGKSIETREDGGSTIRYTKWYPTYGDLIFNYSEYIDASLETIDLKFTFNYALQSFS
jgi:hypothetical protein